MSERSSGVEWVGSQISGGDDVSMDGGCGERRMRRGKRGKERR